MPSSSGVQSLGEQQLDLVVPPSTVSTVSPELLGAVTGSEQSPAQPQQQQQQQPQQQEDTDGGEVTDSFIEEIVGGGDTSSEEEGEVAFTELN